MRKPRHEEHENHDRWLVSYADFITLLFAFFVVLYATSSQNEEKEKKFESAIRAQFKMSGGFGDTKNESGSISGPVIEPLETNPIKRDGNADLEELISKKVSGQMSPEEKRLAINGMRHDAAGVHIALAAENFFPSGSSRLRLQGLKSLDKLADILKDTDKHLIIEGHTDDTPIVKSLKGKAYPDTPLLESNWELGSLRATSVVRYLIKYHGIDPSRLTAISYADTKPLAPNDSPENRAKNRRIEVLIETEPRE